MQKWIDNINNVMTKKEVGTCPYCGSDNTDYRIIQIAGTLGTADIWCNKCKNAVHLSRITVNNDMIKNIELPKSLKY